MVDKRTLVSTTRAGYWDLPPASGHAPPAAAGEVGAVTPWRCELFTVKPAEVHRSLPDGDLVDQQSRVSVLSYRCGAHRQQRRSQEFDLGGYKC